MTAIELNTELVTASKLNQRDKVLSLLAYTAMHNLTPVNLDEPLSWAAHNGHVDVASLLLENGACVNYQDTEGNTPLHWAAYNGHTDMIKLLIVRGANERLLNKNLLTPAKFAELQAKTHPHVHFIPKLIDEMAKEIIRLNNEIVKLQQQLSQHNTTPKASLDHLTHAQLASRVGMMKFC